MELPHNRKIFKISKVKVYQLIQTSAKWNHQAKKRDLVIMISLYQCNSLKPCNLLRILNHKLKILIKRKLHYIWILPKKIDKCSLLTRKNKTRKESKEQPWNHQTKHLVLTSIHVRDRATSNQIKIRHPVVNSKRLTEINKKQVFSNFTNYLISNKSRSNNCFKTRPHWMRSNSNFWRCKLWKTNNYRILNKLFCCNNSGCSSLRQIRCNSCSKS